jgi:phosphohistidine phosphatase
MAAGEKHLYLLRHAKSSWTDPGLPDHDRPLAPRGRKAAALIGEHLRGESIGVELVLCSSAQRARETLDLLRTEGQVEIEDELYGASAEELLERLHQVSERIATVLLVGHNPAIHELASGLTGARSGLAEHKYPTGALAELAFTGSWSDLRPQGANLQAFVRPRDLG